MAFKTKERISRSIQIAVFVAQFFNLPEEVLLKNETRRRIEFTKLQTTVHRRVRRGRALSARAPPHLRKRFRSEMSKRGKKVPPRYIGKNECALSAQIRQNQNKKGREKEEKSKRKGVKLKK